MLLFTQKAQHFIFFNAPSAITSVHYHYLLNFIYHEKQHQQFTKNRASSQSTHRCPHILTTISSRTITHFKHKPVRPSSQNDHIFHILSPSTRTNDRHNIMLAVHLYITMYFVKIQFYIKPPTYATNPSYFSTKCHLWSHFSLESGSACLGPDDSHILKEP